MHGVMKYNQLRYFYMLYFRNYQLKEKSISENDCLFLPGKFYIITQSIIVYYIPILLMIYLYGNIAKTTFSRHLDKDSDVNNRETGIPITGRRHINTVSLPEKRDSQLDSSIEKGYPQVAVNTISSKVQRIDSCEKNTCKEYSNSAFQFDVSMMDISITVDQDSAGKVNEMQSESCNRRKHTLQDMCRESQPKIDVSHVQNAQSVSLNIGDIGKARPICHSNSVIENKLLDNLNVHRRPESIPEQETYNSIAEHGSADISIYKTNSYGKSTQIGHSTQVSHSLDQINHSTQMAHSTQMNHKSHQRRINKTLGVIILTFLTCWLPFCISWPIDAFCGCVDDHFYTFAYWAAYFNSFLNPCLYFLFNQDFTRALKTLLHCKRKY